MLLPASAEVCEQMLDDTIDSLYPGYGLAESAVPPVLRDSLRYEEITFGARVVPMAFINTRNN